MAVKIEYSDRRFVYFEGLNDKLNDKAYFKELRARTIGNDVTTRAFYDFLISINIEEFDPVNDRPVTEAYQEVKDCPAPPIARFLQDFIDEMEENKEEEKILPCREFYDWYKL